MKGRWQQEYYMPANADTGVIAWRQWFQRYGRTEPTSLLPAPPLLPREQVSAHTLRLTLPHLGSRTS